MRKHFLFGSKARFAVSMVAMFSLIGCQSFNKLASYDLNQPIPWKAVNEKKPEAVKPAKMVALWTETVMTQPGKPPVRGMGGRIYFYDAKHQAVPVEGELVVYGFDDTVSDSTNRKPDKKFAFKPDQFAKHFSVTDIGASYSVWLPWDAVGGDLKKISLIPVFSPTKGEIVMGDQTKHALSGPKKDEALVKQQKSLEGAIQPVGYDEPAARPLSNSPTSGMKWKQVSTNATGALADRTTTIDLSPSMRQRLLSASEESVEPAAEYPQPTLYRPSQGQGSVRPTGHSAPTARPQPGYSSQGRPSQLQGHSQAGQRPAGSSGPATGQQGQSQQGLGTFRPRDSRWTAPATHFEPTQPRALGEPIPRPRQHPWESQPSHAGLPPDRSSSPSNPGTYEPEGY